MAPTWRAGCGNTSVIRQGSTDSPARQMLQILGMVARKFRLSKGKKCCRGDFAQFQASASQKKLPTGTAGSDNPVEGGDSDPDKWLRARSVSDGVDPSRRLRSGFDTTPNRGR